MRMRWVLAILICAAAIKPCAADTPVKMLCERAACALLKQHHTGTPKAGSDCLFSSPSDGHWFLFALTEHCGLCVYSLTDWYTVDRRTGEIQKSAKHPPGTAPRNSKLHWTAD